MSQTKIKGNLFFAILLCAQIITAIVLLFNIPFLRQAVGFVYLLFIPGYLLLKIIGVYKTSRLESVVLSLGLSIAFIMLLYLVLNFLGPIVGIAHPLAVIPSVVTIFVVVMTLYVIVYIKTGHSGQIILNYEFPKRASILLYIPLITIIGTELAMSSNNIILLLLIIMISAIIFLSSSSKQIVPTEIYPLALFVISFFLLFHMSLISNNLIIGDIDLEFYFARLTSIRMVWDNNIPHAYNSMLSITILPVVFSNTLNLSINWIYKIVYPLIFSFVPLTLYLVYKRQIDNRFAFLSVFFFISEGQYYTEMLGLARQMIAEIFLALLILVMVMKDITQTKRRLLFMIFSSALILSHYAITYIYMFFLVFTFLSSSIYKDSKNNRLITFSLVFLYIVISLSWYVFISKSALIEITEVLSHIFIELYGFASGPGVIGFIPGYVTPLHEISKYLYLILQFNTIVGFVISFCQYAGLYKFKETLYQDFGLDYYSMSLASIIILIMCIFVPSFASSLNMSRFLHIALFFLAPFGILGNLMILNLLRSLFSKLSRLHHSNMSNSLFVSVLLISLFLFRIGFVYEVTGDVPSSLPLSLHRIKANPYNVMDVWSIYIAEYDVACTNWLSTYSNPRSNVYADRFGINVWLRITKINTSISYIPASSGMYAGITYYNFMLPEEAKKVEKGAYIFLNQLNVVYGKMVGNAFWNITSISPLLDSSDKIYSNGNSDIHIKF